MLIDQTDTYTYNAAQKISNYLKPLRKIENRSFSQKLSTLSPLEENKDDILCCRISIY